MEKGTGSDHGKKAQQPSGSISTKKRYNCKECSKSYSHRRNLISHERVHTGENTFPCDFCTKTFTREDSLANHRRKHTGEKPFRCDLCRKSFPLKSSLTRHRKMIHFPEQLPKLPCPDCGKIFVHKPNLVRHQLIHQDRKPFSCVFCPRKFRQAGNLRQHLSRHAQEKAFFCKDCDKCFVSKVELKIHHSGHTGDKYFKCPHPNCTVAFFYRALLTAHRRQFHKEDVGVAHLCIFCNDGIEFIRKQELNAHLLRKHFCEKPHFCKGCDKCFTTSSELTEHSNRKHHQDGDKKFRCCHCFMTFYSNGQMGCHMRSHHRNEDGQN